VHILYNQGALTAPESRCDFPRVRRATRFVSVVARYSLPLAKGRYKSPFAVRAEGIEPSRDSGTLLCVGSLSGAPYPFCLSAFHHIPGQSVALVRLLEFPVTGKLPFVVSFLEGARQFRCNGYDATCTAARKALVAP
jgi:hypothetical protein